MAQDINALAPVSSLPDKDEWGTIFGMAQQLVPTGFLPKAIDTPQKAAAVMLKGRELGIPAMYALSNIAVIQGKPTANAELMLALVKRAYGRDAIWMEKSTPEVAKIGYLVHGKPKFYEFTIDMAKKAGLLSNQTWTKYPDAMLRARAVSAVCRMEFPEVIGGMYVHGELGERVQVDEATGEITSYDYEIPNHPNQEPVAKVDIHGNDPMDAIARLEAVAEAHGITTDDLHRQAVAVGRANISDYDAATLHKTADAIEQRPDDAKAYYEKLRQPKVEPEPTPEPTDEQQAEMEAINAAVGAQFDAQHAGHGDA